MTTTPMPNDVSALKRALLSCSNKRKASAETTTQNARHQKRKHNEARAVLVLTLY